MCARRLPGRRDAVPILHRPKVSRRNPDPTAGRPLTRLSVLLSALALLLGLFVAGPSEAQSEDTTAPSLTFDPADGETVIDPGTNITLTFNEPIRQDSDGTHFWWHSDLKPILTLKRTNASGANILYTASIDTAKKVITINPALILPGGAVYVAVSNGYFDAHGNQGTAANATFTVDTTAKPSVTFDPADGETVIDPGTNITLTFTEPIRQDSRGSRHFRSHYDLSRILTLRRTNAGGASIRYTASIDTEKKVITINPTSSLPGGAVYVAVSNRYYDAHGNQGTAANATFTVDTTAKPSVTFDPADGETVTSAVTRITLTFTEAVRRTRNGAKFIWPTDFASVLTLKAGGRSGTDIRYGIGTTFDKHDWYLTSTNIPDGDVYVAISDGYYDVNGNQGTAASATFTVDTTGPSPTFEPADGATVTDAGTNITLTFDEAVKRDSGGADFTSETHLKSVLTLKRTNASGANIPYAASIDTAKKVITLNPTSNLADGDVYVALSSGYYDAHGHQGTAENATFTVDSTGVAAPTFDPADDATVTNAGTNITLTFDEAIKKNSSNADFTGHSDLSPILTLKRTNASGANIAYAASIDTAKKVITLNPTSNLADGDVYVAVSTGYYDGSGNQGQAASVTFTVDATGPSPTFDPADDETDTNAGTNITLTFDEAIKRDSGGTDFTRKAHLKSILTLKRTNAGGANIPYAASIDTAKEVITLNPTSNLADGDVYVAVSDGYYDAHGNQGAAASVTFTVDTTGPSPTFDPADGATETNAGTNITLTFGEAVKQDSGGTDFTGHYELSQILTLTRTNASGAKIPYAASIDAAKKVITLNPTWNLVDGDVYVAVSNGYYDAHGHQGQAASVTFTVDSTGPAQPTFDPAYETVKDTGTNITLTFGEAIKRDSGGADFTRKAHLKSILTLKRTNASGADIPYAASIDTAKKVITINPTSSLPEGAVYVAISDGYYDGKGNQGYAANVFFTVDSTWVAPPTFDPEDDETVTDTGTNITLTFGEAVKRDSGGADFTSETHLKSILTLKRTNAGGAHIPYAASIDTAKKVITINPTSSLPEGAVYVATSDGYYDVDGHQGQAASVTFTVDSTGPAQPTFDPADGETVINEETNITLTFGEAITKDTGGTDFRHHSDLSSILTLKRTNARGANIRYAASIDTAKKVITINPTSSLPGGAVYVAVSSGYYDAHGNQGAPANATFTVDTTTSPSMTFDPADGETVTDAGTNITLTFTEPVRRTRDGAKFLGFDDFTSVLTLKAGGRSGTDIPYGVGTEFGKNVWYLSSSNLSDGDVYVAISDGYYDVNGNQGQAASATFTVDTTGPSPTFDPAGGATVTDACTNITLTFDEAITKDTRGTAFATADLAGILTLKQTNASGQDISYTASIDSAKRVITINPTWSLPGGVVYVAVSNGYFDAHGNQGTAENATFTAMRLPPAAPDLTQALGSTSGSPTVTLNWNSPRCGDTITKYQVDWRKTGETGETWRDIRNSGSLTTMHTVKGLEDRVEYEFRIRAVNDVDPGAASAVKWATPGNVTVHGVTLTRFRAEPYDDRIELGWRKLSGRTYCGYVVEWRESGAEEWSRHEIGGLTGDNPRHTIRNLQSGTDYEVRVLVQSGYTDIDPELAWETTRTTTGEAPSNAPPMAGPGLEWARVNGAEMALRFDAALDEASVPAASAFAVSVAGAARAVSEVSVSRDTVTLTLALAVSAGEAVTVGYTPPSSGKLRRAGGGDVAAFSGQAVTNDTPAPGEQQQESPPGAVAALTASVASAPSEHRGKGKFVMRVAFSEAVTARAKDAGIQVTGGTLSRAVRVNGRADLWELRITPSGYGALTVTLPATSDCAASGAVCTADGRKLATALTHTVPGPVQLSVADARATEGEDASIDFAVTLSRAASGAVTVHYATKNGSAEAGRDFRKAKGTLTFAAGETAKTVSVALLDDAKDEGEETFRLVLSKPEGAVIIDGEATGTIENDDPMPAAWLARFGRTVAGQAVDAVTARLEGGGSSQMTLGGQQVSLDTPDGQAQAAADIEAMAALGAGPDGADGVWSRERRMRGEDRVSSHTMTGRELLLGSAFHLQSGGEAGGPAFAAWGRAARGSFDGDQDGVTMNGEVTTGFLGADVASGRWLAGAAAAHSEGEGSYGLSGGTAGESAFDKGKVESSLTSVLPYARLELNDRVTAWGLLGYGTGELTLTEENGSESERPRADLTMTLGVVGGRGTLVPAPEGGGFELALKTDAFWVRTESDAAGGMEGAKADATRLRLTLDASRPFALEGGGTLTPSLEIGLRHDGGDAETGAGVELGGGLAWADPASGVTAELRGRGLAAHEDSGYEEWGVSGSVRVDPGERGRGLSLTLAPTAGNAASGTGTLWSAADARGLAPGGEFEAGRRLDAEVGYGLAMFGDRFTGTPNLGVALSDSAREYRLGWRLTSAMRGDPGFEIGLDGTRTEIANHNAAPEHGVMLRGAIRW